MCCWDEDFHLKERGQEGWVESAIGSVEMKDFSFGVFNYKTKLFKKIRKNIIAIKKMTIRNVKQIALRDEKTIVYKRDEGDGNF